MCAYLSTLTVRPAHLQGVRRSRHLLRLHGKNDLRRHGAPSALDSAVSRGPVKDLPVPNWRVAASAINYAECMSSLRDA